MVELHSRPSLHDDQHGIAEKACASQEDFHSQFFRCPRKKIKNALLNAYANHKIGIDVKVCTVTGFQNTASHLRPNMFSVHDNLFVTLYYFYPAKPLTNLLLEDKHIAEFGSFYDELFRDDRLCTDIETVLADADCGETLGLNKNATGSVATS